MYTNLWDIARAVFLSSKNYIVKQEKSKSVAQALTFRKLEKRSAS